MGNICGVRDSGYESSEYEKHLSNCVESETDFLDKKYPPEPESLVEDWNDQDPEVVECVNSWKDIEWIRIKDIESLGPEAVVFAGKIEPSDIKQG